MRQLTAKSIDALPPAQDKRYEVWDPLLPGMHLRVSATGRKIFYLSKRVNGHVDLPRISGEALAHFTARFSNCTGLW